MDATAIAEHPGLTESVITDPDHPLYGNLEAQAEALEIIAEIRAMRGAERLEEWLAEVQRRAENGELPRSIRRGLSRRTAIE